MARPPKVRSEMFLEAALEGLELRKARIDDEIRQVRALMGRRGRGRPPKNAAAVEAAAAPAPAKRRRRRRLNADARKRIAAAQKKRWADFRKKKGGSEA